MKYLITILPYFLITTVCVSCSSKPDPYATPRQISINFAQALIDYDAASLRKLFYNKVDYRNLAAALPDYYESISEFKHKLIEHYGEKAWVDFNDPGLHAPDPSYQFDRFDHELINEIKNGTFIEHTPDKIYMKTSSLTIYLQRIDEKWQLLPTSLFDPRYREKDFIENRRRHEEVFRKYTKILGKTKHKTREIDYQLSLDVPYSPYFSRSKYPKIFDIDEIIKNLNNE